MHAQRVETRGTLPFPEMASWLVDYQALLGSINSEAPSWLEDLQGRLLRRWQDVYLQHCPAAGDLQVFPDEAGTFVLDCTWSVFGGATTGDESIPDDRLVAALGISRTKGKGRPAGRIRGFPRGGLGLLLPECAQDFDRGHHLAHASGGGVDVNLYPQLASVNRGRDADGKVLRAMERYAARHEGTLVFSRPLYFGISDHPAAIDFGVLRADGVLWQEVFPNVRSLEHLALLDRALKLIRRRGLSGWPENGRELLEEEGE